MLAIVNSHDKDRTTYVSGVIISLLLDIYPEVRLLYHLADLFTPLADTPLCSHNSTDYTVTLPPTVY